MDTPELAPGEGRWIEDIPVRWGKAVDGTAIPLNPVGSLEWVFRRQNHVRSKTFSGLSNDTPDRALAWRITGLELSGTAVYTAIF
jgi:hypothetical protein